MLVLFLLLPCALSAGLKAGPYGHIEPAQTLVAFPAPSATNDPSANRTTSTRHNTYQPFQAPDTEYGRLVLDIDLGDPDTSDDDYDQFGQYLPIGSTEDTTMIQRAGILQKRAAFRGTMQIDCLEAPEVCQNACWYQNCLMGAQGSITAVTFQDGGRNSARDSANPLQSGVTTTHGRPCTSWPFRQKFWDTYPFNTNPSQRSETYLEPDEWPMASFENPAFDPTADPPQHTLRCITGLSNKGGARVWTNFCRGNGPYAEGG